MTNVKTQIATFAAGAGLIAAGLSPVPMSQGLLTAGAGLASLAYSMTFLTWRAKGVPGKPSGRPTTPPQQSFSTPTPTTAPSPAAPAQPQPMEATSAPPTLAPSSFPVKPAYPQIVEAAPPASAPTPPSAPAAPPSQQFPSQSPSAPTPEASKRKLPEVKVPKVTLPKVIIDHKVPIALLVIGLPLVVAGLIFVGITPSVALGYGIFIPGVLLFGVGGLILFLQLYRKPPGLRRFCMHCGFPMMTTDFECGRCHLQPPSGIDTKECPNCKAVIPALAKFCKDCGAGQPA